MALSSKYHAKLHIDSYASGDNAVILNVSELIDALDFVWPSISLKKID